jgi:hypothetical protein
MISAELASRLGNAEFEAKRCKEEINALLPRVARLLIAMQWILERCDKGGDSAIHSIRSAATSALLDLHD